MKIVFISSNSKETHIFIESEIKKNFKDFLIIKQNKTKFFFKIKLYIKYFLRLFKFKLKGNKNNKKYLFFFPKFNNKNSLFLNKKNEDHIIKSIQSFNPNIIVVYSSWLLPKKLYSNFFCLNLHTGISPFYRGSDTTEWAIHESNFYFTGYTIHRISDQIDLGKVFSINTVYPIITESYNDFKYRLHFTASRQILKILNNIDQESLFDISNLNISDVKKKFYNNKILNNFKSNNYNKFLHTLYNKNFRNKDKIKKEISNGNYIFYLNLEGDKIIYFFKLYEKFIKNNFKSINLSELSYNKSISDKPNILFIKTNKNKPNQKNNNINQGYFISEFCNQKKNIYKYSYNNNIFYFIKKDNNNIISDLVKFYTNSDKSDFIILNLGGINNNTKQNYFYTIEITEKNINNFNNLIYNTPLLN